MWHWRPRIDRRTTASWPIRVLAQRIERSIDGLLLDVALAADDAVGADTRPGLDDRAFVDEARPLDVRPVLDARLGEIQVRDGPAGEQRRSGSARP